MATPLATKSNFWERVRRNDKNRFIKEAGMREEDIPSYGMDDILYTPLPSEECFSTYKTFEHIPKMEPLEDPNTLPTAAQIEWSRNKLCECLEDTNTQLHKLCHNLYALRFFCEQCEEDKDVTPEDVQQGKDFVKYTDWFLGELKRAIGNQLMCVSNLEILDKKHVEEGESFSHDQWVLFGEQTAELEVYNNEAEEQLDILKNSLEPVYDQIGALFREQLEPRNDRFFNIGQEFHEQVIAFHELLRKFEESVMVKMPDAPPRTRPAKEHEPGVTRRKKSSRRPTGTDVASLFADFEPPPDGYSAPGTSAPGGYSAPGGSAPDGYSTPGRSAQGRYSTQRGYLSPDAETPGRSTPKIAISDDNPLIEQNRRRRYRQIEDNPFVDKRRRSKRR